MKLFRQNHNKTSGGLRGHTSDIFTQHALYILYLLAQVVKANDDCRVFIKALGSMRIARFKFGVIISIVETQCEIEARISIGWWWWHGIMYETLSLLFTFYSLSTICKEYDMNFLISNKPQWK